MNQVVIQPMTGGSADRLVFDAGAIHCSKYDVASSDLVIKGRLVVEDEGKMTTVKMGDIIHHKPGAEVIYEALEASKVMSMRKPV